MPHIVTRVRLLSVGIALLIPALGSAQGIAGAVRDTSGAVLPGVTVEASSPALIEKARTALTDSQGLYSIVQLVPGTYSVTFVLPGFSTVRREGIVLTTGFTANVNADLPVSAVAETIVVSAEAPIVDTRTTKQTAILTNEVIEVIPTGRTSTSLAQLIPAISIQEGGGKFQDVGGLAGEGNSLVIHGSRDNEGHWLVNGMPYSNLSRANSGIMRLDVGQVEEFALETSGISAEYREGGVAMNLVGKEGSNTFSATFFGAYAAGRMQGSNFDDELRARGVGAINKLERSYDWNPSVGGPLVPDRVWYFGSFRYWGTDNLLAGVFYDSNLTDFFYTPDLSRQHVWVESLKNAAGRVTWQASRRNKFQVYVQQQPRVGFASQVLNLMPEGRAQRDSLGNGNIYDQVLYSSPVTSRLLLEGGASYFLERTDTHAIEGLPTNTSSALWSIQEASSGIIYNYPASVGPGRSAMHAYRFAVSYVTGTHTLKVGFTEEQGTAGPTVIDVPRDMTLRFENGVPNRITLQVSPRFTNRKLNHMTGIFVNDQWTRNRLTLNLGLRFDYKNASVPAQDQPAGRFLPARHYDEVKNVPNFKDFGPRVGAAYDLFGNGKTALKFSLSRYVGGGNYTAEANRLDPVTTTVNNANRSWSDLNGNFIPDCDFLAPAGNGECGPLGNLDFGRDVVRTSIDPAIIQGWHVRPYNIEAAFTLQHQLTDRIGIDAGYYRRSYGNFTAEDNTLVVPGDFDQYCFRTPIDRRLPGGGGQELCGYYDIRPAKFGQEFLHITTADTFGTHRDVYDGVDLSVKTRFRTGAVLQGGFSTGRERVNRCYTVDSPQATLATPGSEPQAICDSRPPFQLQAKLIASFTLPGDIILATTLQNTAGPQITATYLVRADETTLDRLFAGGNANTTREVEIVPPGTMYGPRVNQLDARVSKVVRLDRLRVQLNLDAFNLFNANPVLAQRNVYGRDGATWQRPELVLPARLVKAGFNIAF